MSQDNQAPVQVDQNPLFKPSKNATEGTDSFILAKLLAECFFFPKTAPAKNPEMQRNLQLSLSAS